MNIKINHATQKTQKTNSWPNPAVWTVFVNCAHWRGSMLPMPLVKGGQSRNYSFCSGITYIVCQKQHLMAFFSKETHKYHTMDSLKKYIVVHMRTPFSLPSLHLQYITLTQLKFSYYKLLPFLLLSLIQPPVSITAPEMICAVWLPICEHVGDTTYCMLFIRKVRVRHT